MDESERILRTFNDEARRAERTDAADKTDPARRLVVTAEEFLAERDEAAPSLLGVGLLVPGGGYLIVGGDGGVGKTILLASAFVALAAGEQEFLSLALPGEPVPMLVLEGEGSRAGFRLRMPAIAEARGHDLARLPVFFADREAELSIENVGPMVEQCGARAVLLDPAWRFHDADENSSSEWRRSVTRPLGELSRRLGIAIAITDHFVKPSETRRGQHKLRGTAAKLNDAGAALRLEYGTGGRSSRVLIFDRVRDGAVPDPDRMTLAIDVRRGHVELDPEGIAEAVPDNPAEEKQEKARVDRSLVAQAKLERAIARMEARPGWDLDAGASERELARETGLARDKRPFLDALVALEKGQKTWEHVPGGGWRRRSPQP